MKGFIYRIYDNTNGNVYYGSTFQGVSQRIADHRSNYKQYLKGKCRNVKSFDIFKNGDYDYSIIEEVECESKYKLHNRERFYIENNECINKYIPNRTNKEYYEDNKDKIKEYREDNKDKTQEYQKMYYEANKDKYKEHYKDNKDKYKKYREDNEDKIKGYREDNKDKIRESEKKYRKDNKDKIQERDKLYYDANKEKINQKMTCECGSIIARQHIQKHRKTKKHNNLLKDPK